jgi:hypothetical protein
MVKLDCRRVGFPQWLSFAIYLGIAETSEGLHTASTTTAGASTSQLEPLESEETWSTHTRSPGILKLKCIQT